MRQKAVKNKAKAPANPQNAPTLIKFVTFDAKTPLIDANNTRHHIKVRTIFQ